MTIELLSPVGSMANLKAAIQKGADAVYLGMQKFSARSYSTNFNENYLKQAVQICKSNNVKIYLAMNTLIKNKEIKDFFNQLSFAYQAGIDAVIIQEISLISLIKESFPQLKIHISTQAGVMNSTHANILKVDRINLARELSKEEILTIRKNFKKELEIFCHGALCVCFSGSCLFSSFLGGRSGNRGKCAQPCRKKYNDRYLLSTKELCLINKLPEIIKSGINSIKIEGRMRTPYYVATVTEAYKEAIQSYYKNNFHVSKKTEKKLHQAFSREFTEGAYSSNNIFNPIKASAKTISNKEHYNVNIKKVNTFRKKPLVKVPNIQHQNSSGKLLIVCAHNQADAQIALDNGADIICYDVMNDDFDSISKIVHNKGKKIYAKTPRLMFDKDISNIKSNINSTCPDGIFAGNLAITALNLNLPIILDNNINSFNDIDVEFYNKNLKSSTLISPELSIKELSKFKNKNFVVFVHGKIRLMTLRHQLKGPLINEMNCRFNTEKIFNGTQILNNKEFALLSRAQELVKNGINQFYIDTEKDVHIVGLYRDILDGKPINDSQLKRNYVLGWSLKGIL
ncbi:U32 family peptidase [Nanoarchaeota archaeon]